MADGPTVDELAARCTELAKLLEKARGDCRLATDLGRRVGRFVALLMDEALGEEPTDLLSARQEVLRATGFLDEPGRRQMDFIVGYLVRSPVDLSRWRPKWRRTWPERQDKLWSGLVAQTEESLDRLAAEGRAGVPATGGSDQTTDQDDRAGDTEALVLDFRARTITFSMGPSVHLNNPGLFLLQRVLVHGVTRGHENGGALPFDADVAGAKAKKSREKLVVDFEKAGRAAKDVKLVLRTRTAKGCKGYVLLKTVDLQNPPPTGEVPFAPGVSPDRAEADQIRRRRGEGHSPRRRRDSE